MDHYTNPPNCESMKYGSNELGQGDLHSLSTFVVSVFYIDQVVSVNLICKIMLKI